MKTEDKKKWDKFLSGHWQKEMPQQEGEFAVAPKNMPQLYFGKVRVFKHAKLGFVSNPHWLGWWWSEPIPTLPKPPEWEASLENAIRAMEKLVDSYFTWHKERKKIMDTNLADVYLEDAKDLDNIRQLLVEGKLEDAAKLANKLDTILRENLPSEVTDLFETQTKSWGWRRTW